MSPAAYSRLVTLLALPVVCIAVPASAGLSSSHHTLVLSTGHPWHDVVVAGDFDGDGRDDLAVTASNLTQFHVSIFRSSTAGFTWVQDLPLAADGFVGNASSLAAGDFDGDGDDELAVGLPSQTGGPYVLAGAVAVYTWNHFTDALILGQTLNEGFEHVSPAAYCGETLAVGSFDDDETEDLAYGCPSKSVGGMAGAGVVHVIYGSGAGLDLASDQTWSQGNPAIVGFPNQYDRFGSALAAGDFDGSGTDDLAIGVIGEAVGGKSGAGAVAVIYSDASGLTADGDQLLHRDLPGVEGDATTWEYFGQALATGNLDFTFLGGGQDLVVGAAGCPACAIPDVPGSVHVFYGTSSGLSTGDDEIWTAADIGTGGVSLFCGLSVVVGRFGSSSAFGSIATGCPISTVAEENNAGFLLELPGGALGVSAAAAKILTAAETAAAPPEQGAYLGFSLAVGDFDADGVQDLAAMMSQGRVLLYLSTLFGDGFETGDLSAWSSSVP